MLDYVHELVHMAERIERLEKTIGEAIQKAPPAMRAVVAAAQELQGVAHITAVTVVAQPGTLSRFASQWELMACGRLVSSELFSANGLQRGAVTKTGNPHL